MELTAHTATCLDGATVVSGSLTILQSEFGVQLDVSITNGDQIVKTESIYLGGDQQTYNYAVALPPALGTQAQSIGLAITTASSGGSPVPVILGMPLTEGPFAVKSSGGVTVCGIPDPSTPTATPEPTPDPDEIVNQLVTLLIEILTAILAEQSQ
jgi:hypothetical protein